MSNQSSIIVYDVNKFLNELKKFNLIPVNTIINIINNCIKIIYNIDEFNIINIRNNLMNKINYELEHNIFNVNKTNNYAKFYKDKRSRDSAIKVMANLKIPFLVYKNNKFNYINSEIYNINCINRSDLIEKAIIPLIYENKVDDYYNNETNFLKERVEFYLDKIIKEFYR